MKRRILVLASFLLFLGLGLLYGQALLLNAYGGACGPLPGFAGFLQQAELLPKGNCKVQPRHPGRCLQPGNRCHVRVPPSGEVKAGRCRQTAQGCVCQVP